MTLNKKKEIIKGLLLIAVLIFFIWGLILTINEDFIYADGTVHVKEASQYITADRTVHFDKASKYVTLAPLEEMLRFLSPKFSHNEETLHVSSSFLRCVRRTQRSENFFEFFKKKSIRGN